VIARLAKYPLEDESTASIARGVRRHRAKQLESDVKAAREREQPAAGCQEFHRPQIDLLVARERPWHAVLRLGECRWIEDDHVEALPPSLEGADVVEHICFDPLDVAEAIALSVLEPPRQRLTGLIDGDDLIRSAREVQREPSLIGEEIEGPASRQRTRQPPVLALVEKCACLLTGPGSHLIVKAMLGDVDEVGDGAEDRFDAERQPFVGSHASVVSEQQAVRLRHFANGLDHLGSDRFESGGEELGDDHIAIPIHDQRGKSICLGVDETIGRGVRPGSPSDGVAELGRPPRLVRRLPLWGEVAEPDLGGWRVERLPKPPTAAVVYPNDPGGSMIRFAIHVGTIDPRVATGPAARPARRYHDAGHGSPGVCTSRRPGLCWDVHWVLERDGMYGRLEDVLRLLVITDPASFVGRDPLSVCRAAVEGGATAIEVRDKAARPRELLALVERLVPAVQVPVLVNDRLDVALAAGAAGCHLGADDFPATEARRLAPSPFILGVSVGTEDEAELMRPSRADYWGVGPCFPTMTKPDAGGAIGPEGFARLRSLAGRTPCVAVGGITAETAPTLIAAGACGVAVASAVIAAPDPREAARQLRRAVDSALAASP